MVAISSRVDIPDRNATYNPKSSRDKLAKTISSYNIRRKKRPAVDKDTEDNKE